MDLKYLVWVLCNVNTVIMVYFLGGMHSPKHKQNFCSKVFNLTSTEETILQILREGNVTV